MTLLTYNRIDEFIDTESRLEVTRSWREREQEGFAQWAQFLLTRFRNRWWEQLPNTVNVINATKSAMVKRENFVNFDNEHIIPKITTHVY